jgi:hypothetical protein
MHWMLVAGYCHYVAIKSELLRGQIPDDLILTYIEPYLLIPRIRHYGSPRHNNYYVR